MDIIKFNLRGDYSDLSQEIIEQAQAVIEKGGSIVYPTDTLYGLGVNALDEYAVSRLFKIKQRSELKPISVMVRDLEMLGDLVKLNRKQEKFLKKVWPGPVTAVLEKKDSLPMALTAGKETVGIRIPDHPFTRALMESLEAPVSCTSANLSSQPGLIRSTDVVRVFNNAYPRPDLFLDAGDLPGANPSAVIDLTGLEPKILRVGPISKKDLDKMFGKN